MVPLIAATTPTAQDTACLQQGVALASTALVGLLAWRLPGPLAFGLGGATGSLVLLPVFAHALGLLPHVGRSLARLLPVCALYVVTSAALDGAGTSVAVALFLVFPAPVATAVPECPRVLAAGRGERPQQTSSLRAARGGVLLMGEGEP
jgi:hypothetical protein